MECEEVESAVVVEQPASASITASASAGREQSENVFFISHRFAVESILASLRRRQTASGPRVRLKVAGKPGRWICSRCEQSRRAERCGGGVCILDHRRAARSARACFVAARQNPPWPVIHRQKRAGRDRLVRLAVSDTSLGRSCGLGNGSGVRLGGDAMQAALAPALADVAHRFE